MKRLSKVEAADDPSDGAGVRAEVLRRDRVMASRPMMAKLMGTMC
jgi:hypothetical protein